MKHTISALVENHFGVLARVSGLFSARGFNIDSLTVGETEDPSISRMTIVVEGDDRILEQVQKQLNKLIDVVKVIDLTSVEFIDRELVLIKVSATNKNRSDLIQIVDIFQARVLEVGVKNITIEATGDNGRINALLDLLRPFGIKELVRTGCVAIER